MKPTKPRSIDRETYDEITHIGSAGLQRQAAAPSSGEICDGVLHRHQGRLIIRARNSSSFVTVDTLSKRSRANPPWLRIDCARVRDISLPAQVRVLLRCFDARTT